MVRSGTALVMVWVCDELLPHKSVAVYFRAMLKQPVQEPAVCTSLLVMVNVPPQLSVATTAPLFAAGTAAKLLTVTFAGMLVITGAVWSLTVMVCVALDALPHASVAI